METKVRNKTKGISLIVLVITILVLAILAATVIISLSNTNVISEASKSVLKSDLTTMQDMATVYMADNYNLVDVEREYLITEFGITDEKYKGYETIATVKAGKVYIKPNAPENVKEVAQELNILIDGVSADNGNVTLDKTATALKIYGNSIENTTTNTIQSVGDKTNNLFNPEEWSTAVTQRGITVQYLKDEDCFVLNGTATITTKIASKYISLKAEVGEKYVVSAQYVSGNVDRSGCTNLDYAVAFFGISDTLNSSTNWLTANLTNDTTLAYKQGKCNTQYITRFWFYVSQGVKFENYKVKVQLEQSDTVTPYEPYGYKIPVTMTGKNIFFLNNRTEKDFGALSNTTKRNFTKNAIYTKVSRNNYHIDYLDISYSILNNNSIKVINNSNSLYYGPAINFSVTPNTDYFLSSEVDTTKGHIGVSFYDKDGNIISFLDSSGTVIKFKTPVNCCWLNIVFAPTILGEEVTFSNICFAESSVDVAYEAYNETTYNIYLTEPLRKVGNAMDYVDCATGNVLRYVGVNSTTGALEALSIPVKEKAIVQNMNFNGVKHIFVDTSVTPSNIEVKY